MKLVYLATGFGQVCVNPSNITYINQAMGGVVILFVGGDTLAVTGSLDQVMQVINAAR